MRVIFKFFFLIILQSVTITIIIIHYKIFLLYVRKYDVIIYSLSSCIIIIYTLYSYVSRLFDVCVQ
jgi:hypothetical protein